MTSRQKNSQFRETVSQSQIRSTPHNTCQPISMKQCCDIRTIYMFCDIPKMLVFTVRERCVLFFKISMALEYEMFSKFCPLISMIWGQTRHNVFMLKYWSGKCRSVQSAFLYSVPDLHAWAQLLRFTVLLHSLDEDCRSSARCRPEAWRNSGDSRDGFCRVIWRHLALAAHAMFSRRRWPFIFWDTIQLNSIKPLPCIHDTIHMFIICKYSDTDIAAWEAFWRNIMH